MAMHRGPFLPLSLCWGKGMECVRLLVEETESESSPSLQLLASLLLSEMSHLVHFTARTCPKTR